jgi:hypothetical protein
MNGGDIYANTASYGGGVYVSYRWPKDGTITKTGGTIYGTDDGTNANTAITSGSAVYVNISPYKRRELTAGPTVNLDSTKDGAEGGWD